MDVPATLVSRVRVLSTGRSTKNDPNDAVSVGVAALRSPGLRRVEAAGHSAVLHLLAKRNTDIGNHRTRWCAACTPYRPSSPAEGRAGLAGHLFRQAQVKVCTI